MLVSFNTEWKFTEEKRSFIDSFLKRGKDILKGDDHHALKMVREYIIDGIKEIKRLKPTINIVALGQVEVGVKHDK